MRLEDADQDSFAKVKALGSKTPSYETPDQSESRLDLESQASDKKSGSMTSSKCAMFDSFSNRRCICKQSSNVPCNYKQGHILAPFNVFSGQKSKTANGNNDDDSERKDDEDPDDGTDMPTNGFKSAREERIYLGRGYNRLGLNGPRPSASSASGGTPTPPSSFASRSGHLTPNPERQKPSKMMYGFGNIFKQF